MKRILFLFASLFSLIVCISCGDPETATKESAVPETEEQMSREEYDRYVNERLEYYRVNKTEGLQKAEDCKFSPSKGSLENADCAAATQVNLEIHMNELGPLNAERTKKGLSHVTIDELYPGVKRRREGPIKEIPKFQ